MKKIDNKKGFTLAELLIVVAIIAVLVAISIPVFSTQLEKSREATDLANVRGAYAEIMAAAIMEDETSPYFDKSLFENGSRYIANVELKQKKDDWQRSDNLVVGGVARTDLDHWIGRPMANGLCTVIFDTDSGEVFINWNGRNIATNLDFMDGAWAGRFTADQTQHVDSPKAIVSTYNTGDSKYKGLYELEGGSTYQVSFTYDPHLDNPDNPTKGIIAKATVLWDSKGKNYKDSGTGDFIMNQDLEKNGVNYRYTTNANGTITYTATFTTGNDSKYYYGMNFGGMNITSDGKVSDALEFKKHLGMTDDQVTTFKNNVKNSFSIMKVK